MRSCDSCTVRRLYRFFFDDTILTASTVWEPLIKTESPDSVLPLAVRDEWAQCVYCGGPKTDTTSIITAVGRAAALTQLRSFPMYRTPPLSVLDMYQY